MSSPFSGTSFFDEFPPPLGYERDIRNRDVQKNISFKWLHYVRVDVIDGGVGGSKDDVN